MTEKNDKIKLVVNNDKKELQSSTADAPILRAVEDDNNRYAGKGVVKLVRLITGEVILGFYKPNGNFSIYVNDPVLIHAAPDQNGQLRIAMMPYMPFSKDEKFEFNMSNVMNVANPQDGLRAQYIQSMTGLIIPNG